MSCGNPGHGRFRRTKTRVRGPTGLRTAGDTVDILATVEFDGPTWGAVELHVPEQMVEAFTAAIEGDARANRTRARVWFGDNLDLEKPDRTFDFRPEVKP